jgi:hypothetical protein
MQSRRDFLKLLGGAIGGVILSSCSGGSGGGSTPSVANGFKFWPLFDIDQALPGFTSIDLLSNPALAESSSSWSPAKLLPGGVMMNENAQIIFFAKDELGRRGWYEMSVDFSKEPPRVLSLTKLVREGDVLGDGETVAHVDNADTDNDGSFVVLVETGEKLPKLYIKRAGGSGLMEPVAGFKDSVPDGNGTFGGNFINLSLYDNDLLLTCHYADQGTGRSYEALFYLPGAQVDGNGQRLLRSDSLTPDANGIISGFGIPCLYQDGNYLVQAISLPSATSFSQIEGTGPFIPQPTLLIHGNVNDPGAESLLAASRELDVFTGAGVGDYVVSGDVIMGPRVGPGNSKAYVVHASDTDMSLYFEGGVIARTGEVLPSGATVYSISAPVIGEDGVLYYLLATDKGLELWGHGGGTSRLILAAGVYGDYINGKQVNSIVHGTHAKQADSQGRLVMVVGFGDGTSSIITGIPV